MYELLKGMRIVEGASFVAAPLCGLTFVQLGADVIRFDPVRGGPDYRRWPVAPNGASYYWEGLNKGKRSVALDLTSEEGRELAIALATANGDDSGYFVTNYPAKSFLAHELLAERRPDLITIRIAGSSDGRNAVDYTINCATGYPYMTGAPTEAGPVNHVLPAWDVATGLTAAVSLLAADRDRQRTGKGREVVVPLSNVAFATLATLGHVAEVQLGDADRPRYGNAVFGTFGRDFVTRDRCRVMIVAVTNRQWAALVTALGIEKEIRDLEISKVVDLVGDEGARFVHRDEIFALVARRVRGPGSRAAENAFRPSWRRVGPVPNRQRRAFKRRAPVGGQSYVRNAAPSQWRFLSDARLSGRTEIGYAAASTAGAAAWRTYG